MHEFTYAYKYIHVSHGNIELNLETVTVHKFRIAKLDSNSVPPLLVDKVCFYILAK
jgi:hypothetical protein